MYIHGNLRMKDMTKRREEPYFLKTLLKIIKKRQVKK